MRTAENAPVHPLDLSPRSTEARSIVPSLMKSALRLLLLVVALPGFAADRPPNLIVIYADDLGYGDLSC